MAANAKYFVSTARLHFFLTFLCISAGGALGALSRFLLSEFLTHRLNVPSYLSIMSINVIGSFLIGYAFLMLEANFRKDGNSKLHGTGFEETLKHKKGLFTEDLTVQAVDYFISSQRLIFISGFFITGFLGGFTTFSSYILYSIHLLEKGDVLSAVINTLLSVFLGFFAVLLGMLRAEHRLKR